MNISKNKSKISTIAIILVLAFAALVVNIPGVGAAEGQEVHMIFIDHARKGFQEGPAPNTPHLLWKTEPTETGPPSWGLVIAEGKVIRGHYDTGDVIAWDVDTGDVIWHRDDLNHTAYGSFYYEGKIYTSAMSKARTMQNITGDMWMCLNATTGDTIWRWKIPETVNGIPQIFPIEPDGYISVVPSQPTVYNDKLWIRLISGGCALLDPDTGEFLTYVMDAGSTLFPAFVDDFLYGVDGGSAFAMNVDTFEKEWTKPIALGGSWVTIDGVYMYVTGDDGNMTKLDRRDGTIIWETPWTARTDKIPLYGNPYGPPPVIAYETIFLGGFEGDLYGFHKVLGTAPRWKFETGGRIYVDSVVADGKWFTGSGDGYVYALTPTGELVWKYYVGDAVTGMMAVADGKLFASTSDGALYCFGPSPPSSISLSAPTSLTVGESLTTSGKFVDEAGVGIADAEVTLRYRVAPQIEWTELAVLTTANDGSYSYTWTPPYDGYCDIRACYQEPEIGGCATADATHTVRVVGTAPEVEVDLTPVTGAISELEGSFDKLESALTTYLIAIVVLSIISIVAIVYVAYRSRNSKYAKHP